jgi:4-amino-4-deoxy-L-arabinose transferase-like glycosyltransferase
LTVFLTRAGIPLVAAGRLVSFAAFAGWLIPLWTLAQDLKISRRAWLVVAIVYLACPFYVYWSRTFMIETTALFFSLCWLAGVVRDRNTPGWLPWLVTAGFGCLAMLAKSTTFLSIGPIAGAVYLYDALVWPRRDRSASAAYGLFRRGLLFLIPIIVGAA